MAKKYGITNPRSRVAAAGTLLAALALAVSGCSAPAPGGESDAPESVEIPSTPVGEQATWVVSAINADEPVAEADVEERASEALLNDVPAPDLAELLTSLQAEKAWNVDAYDGDDTQAVATITSRTGHTFDLQVVVDDESLLIGLLFGEPAGEHESAASWGELESAVGALGADTRLTVTEVVDGAAGETVFATGPTEAMPVGSIVKLYVLGAVADAVEADELTWETTLTVTDDLRSLPSGRLQDEPAGTEVTVREAAELMISISDNTATDLLIDAVGVEAVEAALTDMGHSDAALNIPLMSTRQMFQVSFGGDELRAEWRDGDVDERRALLAGLSGGALEYDGSESSGPGWQEGIEWFATSDDLVAAHLALQEKAAAPEGAPVREILAVSSGLTEATAGLWDYVGFKGGSNEGVLAGSWLVESGDRTAVIVLQAAGDARAAVQPEESYVMQADDAARLLAAE